MTKATEKKAVDKKAAGKPAAEKQEQIALAQAAETAEFGTVLAGFRVSNNSTGRKPVTGTGIGRSISPGGFVDLTEAEYALLADDIDAKKYLSVEEIKE